MLSKEDRVSIKMQRVEKGYGAKRLMADVPRRNWSLAAVKRLLQKIDLWWVMLFTNSYFSKVKVDLHETK